MTPPEIIATVGTITVSSILPTTAVTIAILRSDAKIDVLSNRLDAKIDAKVDSVRSDLGSKIDNFGNRFDSKLDSKVDGLRADIRGDISILDKIAYDHHGRITCLEAGQNGKPEA